MEICKAWKDMMDEMMEKGESKGKSEGMMIGKSEGMRIGRSEGITIGRNEGKSEESERIVSNMLKNDFHPEEIARITGIDLKEVEEIEEKLKCVMQ